VKQFDVSRRALRDLREIWEFISEDSFNAADRVLEDFYRAFGQLAETPGMGHSRADLIHSYLVIYTVSKPLRIVRVLSGGCTRQCGAGKRGCFSNGNRFVEDVIAQQWIQTLFGDHLPRETRNS